MGATASDQRESAVRTLLDEAHQLTIHTADFLRALAVAPELFVLTKH